MISGEHDCPRSGGKALGEKYGEDVAETLESSRVILSRQGVVVVAAEDGVVIVVDDKGGDPGDKDAVCRLRTLVEVRAALVAGVLSADTERCEVGGVDRTVE